MQCIWLDDVRRCPHLNDIDHNWCTRTNPEDFKNLIRYFADRGEKIHTISFDHDLASDITGYDLIKWMWTFFPDAYPQRIECHSDNPVGKENILKFDELVRKQQVENE